MRSGASCRRSGHKDGSGIRLRIPAVKSWPTLAPDQDTALSTLMEDLTPLGTPQFYTDNWGAYSRQLDSQQRTMGKPHPQKIERQHLT